MNKQKLIGKKRLRRRHHVRSKLRGTAERPRLSIHRSLKHVSCQLVDDMAGRTILSVSTRDKGFRDNIKTGGGKEAAAAVGKAVAERALAAGVKQVRFDRGHCKYHGRVAALADAAREGGLQF